MNGDSGMNPGELAVRLGCRLEGDAQVEILGTEGLESAKPGDISFLSNPRYAHELPRTRASAVLVTEKVVIKRDAKMRALAALRSENPYLDFARTIEFFHTPETYLPVIRLTAVSAKVATVAPGA